MSNSFRFLFCIETMHYEKHDHTWVINIHELMGLDRPAAKRNYTCFFLGILNFKDNPHSVYQFDPSCPPLVLVLGKAGF